jgi:hypothetical protein
VLPLYRTIICTASVILQLEDRDRELAARGGEGLGMLRPVPTLRLEESPTHSRAPSAAGMRPVFLTRYLWY